MKKAFISILLFYLVFHFIIPGTYFLINGYFNLYSDIDDVPSTVKGFLLNAFMILGASVVIWIIPERKKAVVPVYYSLGKLLYLALGINIFYFFLRGGFSGTSEGNLGGSLLSYIVMFFKPTLILMAILFYQKKKVNAFFYIILVVAGTLLTGSRSGFIIIILAALLLPIFKNYSKYKSGVRRVLLILLMTSPLVFILATVVVRKATDFDITPEMIANQIAGRVSFLETSMLPVHYKDLGNTDFNLFYRKYSLLNQGKLALDAMIPGPVFEYDVFPNQYYRAVFLGYSEDWALNNYTSINITLPIYLYMYMDGFWAVLLGITLLVTYYLLCRLTFNKPVLFLPLLASLYTFLYFFDLDMWFMEFFVCVLTMVCIVYYSAIRNFFVAYCRRVTVRGVIKSKLEHA